MEDRLKMVRKALGLNQKELSEVLGISQSTYCLYEKGRREIQNRYIMTLERVYDVNPDWLRTGEGDMFLQSKDEDEVIKMLGELNEENKQLIAEFISKLLKSQS